jgi:hypothetical protein
MMLVTQPLCCNCHPTCLILSWTPLAPSSPRLQVRCGVTLRHIRGVRAADRRSSVVHPISDVCLVRRTTNPNPEFEDVWCTPWLTALGIRDVCFCPRSRHCKTQSIRVTVCQSQFSCFSCSFQQCGEGKASSDRANACPALNLPDSINPKHPNLASNNFTPPQSP